MTGGHGGTRPGSGRKPKDPALRAIDGGAGRRPSRASHQPPPPTSPDGPVIAPIERFPPPAHLTKSALRVWDQLAPFAFTNRTLTKATALAFEILCRNIALERSLSRKRLERGGPNHRGLLTRVDAELLRFNLAPCGKPMYLYEQPADAGARAPATPVNPLERFLKRAT